MVRQVQPALASLMSGQLVVPPGARLTTEKVRGSVTRDYQDHSSSSSRKYQGNAMIVGSIYGICVYIIYIMYIYIYNIYIYIYKCSSLHFFSISSQFETESSSDLQLTSL